MAAIKCGFGSFAKKCYVDSQVTYRIWKLLSSDETIEADRRCRLEQVFASCCCSAVTVGSSLQSYCIGLLHLGSNQHLFLPIYNSRGSGGPWLIATKQLALRIVINDYPFTHKWSKCSIMTVASHNGLHAAPQQCNVSISHGAFAALNASAA